jgi:hypothetical protein
MLREATEGGEREKKEGEEKGDKTHPDCVASCMTVAISPTITLVLGYSP